MPNRRSFLGFALALATLTISPHAAFAGAPEVFNTAGIAINGYDPVAYFKANKPVQGKPDLALKWMGVTWYFSSAANMATFEADPHGFAPQYGGYCAYAMSQGAIANTVPEAWTVNQGKLYLNFSTGVRGIWKKDISGHVKAANTYWPAILNK